MNTDCLTDLTVKMIRLFPMPEKLRTFCLNSVQLIVYVFIGALTTLIDFAVFALCVYCTEWQFSIPFGSYSFPVATSDVATVIAWIAAVTFAFFANKLFVFDSKCMAPKTVLKEMVQFAGCRLGSLAVCLALMHVTVVIFGWHELLMKILVNVIDMLLNFFASKFLIFRKKSGGKTENR